MPAVDLTQEEWTQLTNVLVDVPWRIANPILYKIQQQLRTPPAPAPAPQGEVIRPSWETPRTQA